MTARLNRAQFLKDVFACALASYGGPEAHYGIFTKELIEKNEYVSQEELTELYLTKIKNSDIIVL